MALSKKKRFEVFKRDNFTCQYCGKKAPDVILECDHIKPKAKKGKNDILNLITSCKDCNRGKGSRELSDTTEIDKQREQIEDLNEKRKQIDMMIEWRENLKNEREYEVDRASDYLNNLFEHTSISIVGRTSLRKVISQFGISDTLEAIDIAYNKYSEYYDNEVQLFNIILDKIGGILYLRGQPEWKKKISYVKGICKNRFRYYNPRKASELINEYLEENGDIDDLIEKTKSDFSHWTDFRNYIEDFLHQKG